MSSSHREMALRNLRDMLSMTFSLMPDERMAFSKSLRCSLRFLPLRVRASSSGSSGIIMRVARRS